MERKGKILVLASLIVILGVFIFLVSKCRADYPASEYYYHDAPEYVTYYTTDNLNCRHQPEVMDGNIIFTLPKGHKVTATGNTSGEWVEIVFWGGTGHGWIHSGYITNEEPTVPSMRLIGQYKITGYTPSPSENGGYDVTCKGVKLSTVIGTCVAVDTRYIPLGTKLYIEGVGYRTAMDTGVRGKVIDVLVSTNRDAYSLTGMKNVYIVE